MAALKMALFALVIFATCQRQSNALILPKIFKDGMVLAAKPTTALVWGKLDIDNGNPVSLNAVCLDDHEVKNTTTDATIQEPSAFEFHLVGEPGMTCNFTFTQSGSSDVYLNDVLFGEVWVCSGQSNMEFRMGGIFNSSDEIKAMADYPNIRMYIVPKQYSDSPQDDLMKEGHWFTTSDSKDMQRMSAVCALTARYISDVLGKDKPFGLIESNWGGTIIEAWMPPVALDRCGIDPFVNIRNPQETNSHLYNAMIHPLTKLSIFGVLWYQGEANAGNHNRDKYNCTFPEMINEWRNVWSDFTSPTFPFGFMQLSTNQVGHTGPGFPIIRWHQTADHGFVPNHQMENVFMGVALDTYDEQNGIHPRNKQLSSKRLATAALSVAYGLSSQFPSGGPFPNKWTFHPNSENDGIDVTIHYDGDFDWIPVESEGFYVCCDQPSFEKCKTGGNWDKLPDDSVQSSRRILQFSIPSCTKALSYLWEETPVRTTMGLPMYAADGFQLPGAPWIKEVSYS